MDTQIFTVLEWKKSCETGLKSFGQPVMDSWSDHALWDYRELALKSARWFYSRGSHNK